MIDRCHKWFGALVLGFILALCPNVPLEAAQNQPPKKAEEPKIRDPLILSIGSGASFDSNAEDESGGRPGLTLDGSLGIDQKVRLRGEEFLKFGVGFAYHHLFFEDDEDEDEEDEDTGSNYNISAGYEKKFDKYSLDLVGKFVDGYDEFFSNKDDRTYRLNLTITDIEDAKNNKFKESLFLEQRFDKLFEGQRTKVQLSGTLSKEFKKTKWTASTKPSVFHEWVYGASTNRKDLGAGLDISFEREIAKNVILTVGVGLKAVDSSRSENDFAEITLPVKFSWKSTSKPIWKWRLRPTE